MAKISKIFGFAHFMFSLVDGLKIKVSYLINCNFLAYFIERCILVVFLN